MRDNIPKLFNLKNTHIADSKEYYESLLDKLQEEVDEFKESGDIEELADIIEVVHAITESKGESLDNLNNIKEEKANKRGKFEKRIIWSGKEKDEN